jgi:23S rRNA maturation mini-RNase III
MLFLYATTKSDVMMYGFAVAFLAFCGYVYLLAQQRQREAAPWHADRWLNS